MRKCPFNDCDRQLPDNLFACRPHWYSLSKADRDTIWSAYRNYMDNVIGIEELVRIQQGVLGKRGTA